MFNWYKINGFSSFFSLSLFLYFGTNKPMLLKWSMKSTRNVVINRFNAIEWSKKFNYFLYLVNKLNIWSHWLSRILILTFRYRSVAINWRYFRVKVVNKVEWNRRLSCSCCSCWMHTFRTHFPWHRASVEGEIHLIVYGASAQNSTNKHLLSVQLNQSVSE